MKKLFRIMMMTALLVCLVHTSAMALNYSGCQDNEATFETLGEARQSGPAAVENLETNVGKVYVSHPVLDGYPEDATFIYRSPNLFGGRAAARLNTNIVVFAEKAFESKDAAFAYLQDLGLIDIINEAIGSVVLVTPANGEAFTQADQLNYYKLQTAMLAQKATGKDEAGEAVSYCDAEYFGGYGYLYVIGIEGGATFLNNFVSSTYDYVSRIAGLLLINGNMDRIRKVAALVPAYLVNASDAVVEKYKAANETDSFMRYHDVDIYFNLDRPLQKVAVVADEEADYASYIKDAYYNMFIKAMRVPVIYRGLYTAATPYQGYGFDEAPYSLCDRNAMINGRTEDGIIIIRHDEDKFSDIQTPEGDYMQTWFEFLPEEVLDGTAPAGTVPLILANHGGGDDPRLFVDEIGLLELIGKERIAIVAGEHQGKSAIRAAVFPKLVEYMLETYPALDASRVYVTGYSMGGMGTMAAIYGKPELFAAAVGMSFAPIQATDEQLAHIAEVGMPLMMTTSSFDAGGAFDAVNDHISEAYQERLNRFATYNDVEPVGEFDFEAYPLSGFKGDCLVVRMLNNEYKNYTWYLENSKGEPVMALSVTEDLIHALYPEFGKIMWDFAKHFSRDPETFEITYDPYVD